MNFMNRIRQTFALSLSLAAAPAALACDELPPTLASLPPTVSFKAPRAVPGATITLNIPELSKVGCKVSRLEYGTDYFFALNGQVFASIDYRSATDGNRSVRIADWLNAEAPMAWAERDTTPHYLEFVDQDYRLKYWLFIGNNGKPVRVDVRTYTGRFNGSELVASIPLN